MYCEVSSMFYLFDHLISIFSCGELEWHQLKTEKYVWAKCFNHFLTSQAFNNQLNLKKLSKNLNTGLKITHKYTKMKLSLTSTLSIGQESCHRKCQISQETAYIDKLLSVFLVFMLRYKKKRYTVQGSSTR